MARDDLLLALLDRVEAAAAKALEAADAAKERAGDAMVLLSPLPDRLAALEARLTVLERPSVVQDPAPHQTLHAVARGSLPLVLTVGGAAFGLGLAVVVGFLAVYRPDLLPSLLGAPHAVPQP